MFDDFRGFVTVVDGRSKFPLTSQNGFLVRPGGENQVVISALKFGADKNVEPVEPSKRGCYFENEYSLKLSKNYTQTNCILECKLNYVRKLIATTGIIS